MDGHDADYELEAGSELDDAAVLYRNEYELWEAGRHGEAVAVVDQLVARHGRSVDPDVWGQVTATLAIKRNGVSQTGAAGDVLAAEDELLARIADATDADLRVRAADALRTKARNRSPVSLPQLDDDLEDDEHSGPGGGNWVP